MIILARQGMNREKLQMLKTRIRVGNFNHCIGERVVLSISGNGRPDPASFEIVVSGKKPEKEQIIPVGYARAL